MNPRKFVTILCIFTLSVCFIAVAYEPHTIFHQGFLTDETGTPVEDDTYIFTFRIYDDESEGNVLWSENQILQVSGGVFNAHLGSETPLDIPFDNKYWVGIAINGGDELSPRMPLSAVPYALHAYSVADGSVTTEKIEDGAVTTAKLAAAVGAAVVDLGSHSGLGTEATNLGSITIEAPSSGAVLLFLSGEAIFFGDNTTMDAGLGSSEGLFDLYFLRFGRLDGNETNRYRLTFNPMAVVNVNAGTHTFYATAEKSTTFDSNTINLSRLQLSAIFIPN